MAKRKRVRGRIRGNRKIPVALTLAREERAWHLKARGYGSVQIAEMLKAEFGVSISRRAVDMAIQRVAEESWRKAAEHVERYKGQQLAALEAIHAEALDSYRRSKGEVTKKRVRQESTPTAKTTKKGTTRVLAVPGPRVTQVDTEQSAGDPRFLNTAIDALKDQRKILGLDAPLKVQDVSKDRPLEQMSDAELASVVAQGEAEERRRADGRS